MDACISAYAVSGAHGTSQITSDLAVNVRGVIGLVQGNISRTADREG